MPDWRQQIKDYLSFSSKERRGVFILLLLLVIVLLTDFILPWLITRKPTDFSEFERQIAAFEAQQLRYQDSISNFYKTGYKESSNAGENITPFEFDPNELSADDWKKLGLEERQIKVILNYKSKGGRFRDKQDFAKMYCISEAEYLILEPYIVIKPLKGQNGNKDVKESEITPYPFDPNNLSRELGIKMGLNPGVINAIIAYRQKGGRFNTPSDLKKIYTLTEEDFQILEPYIRIVPDTSLSLPARKMVMVELNSADTLDLQQIHGVGPSFSKRIVKYRDLLGGFCNKEQLLEVYGMDSARYLNMVNEVMVDKEKIRKININKVSIKEMTNHPYIEYYVAKSIVNYRNEKGTFTDLRQIEDAKLIYHELFLKIEPYLSLK